MSAMSSPAWESGPAPRRYDIEEHYYECCGCGGYRTRNESYGCQGDSACESRMGECCKRECNACGLTACPLHLVDYGGELTCASCVALMVEEAEEEMKR